MFAGDHAIQIAGNPHDAFDGTIGLVQHLVVVGIHRDVGVHIAVAGMHVQRNPHAAAQHAFVDFFDGLQHRRKCAANEQPAQMRAHFRLPRSADRSILDKVEDAHVRLVLQSLVEIAAHRLEAQHRQLRHRCAQLRIEVLVQVRPARTRRGDHLLRLELTIADQFLARSTLHVRIVDLAQFEFTREIATKFARASPACS